MPKVKKINKKKTSNVIPIKKDVIETDYKDQLSIEDQERMSDHRFVMAWLMSPKIIPHFWTSLIPQWQGH